MGGPRRIPMSHTPVCHARVMPADELGAVVGRALDQLTDFVAVLDDVGTVVYLNTFASQLLGYTPDEVVGTSIADHVHPDDLARAIGVMGRMAEDEMGLPVTPAFYRLRRRDGAWMRIELNATLVVDDENGGNDHITVLGRYSGDHDLQDRVMALLTSGEPADEAIALVPEFGFWRHAGADYAVFFLDDEGVPRSAGSAALTALGGLEDPTTPWSRVAHGGEELVEPIRELDASYAERARAACFTHVWGVPVADPLHGSYAVVAFARHTGGATAEVHGYAIDVMVKSLQLILLWRHQVLGLRRAARLDALTGVANRSGFLAVLDEIDERNGHDMIGVLFIDLDGFKAVNDRHGHAVGDMVLVEVARRLERVVRPGDEVARLGGDEFAVVALGLASEADAAAIASRIVAAIGEPFVVAGEKLELGASVGVATVADGDFDPDQFLEQADRALYRAKQAGRGRWADATADRPV